MKSLLLSTFLFILGAAQAQNNGQFSGRVIDSTDIGLEMVSVALLNPQDSTLESFTITDRDGYFKTDKMPAGTYLLQLSFLGYATISREVVAGTNSGTSNLGTLIMKPELNVLSEVVVSGQRIPILINKDTVEYDAAAFRVRAEDNVEDLLKRLPGIEVDRDGKITAQGQEVSEVLVDGKKFFGGDPTVATRNIPADAVKSVKVYDGQTEDAKFTGVDDGERNKTLDLELKEDRKKGVFGYVEGGAGTEERFVGKAGVHRFTPTTRVSFLGNVNNINDYGFSYGDYRDMAGAASGPVMISSNGPMPINWSGPNDGLFFSGATGVNLNWDPTPAHRMSSSYFFTHLDNVMNRRETSQEFINEERLDGILNENSRSFANGHRFNIEHRSDLDSMNRIELKASGNYNFSSSTSQVEEKRNLNGGEVLQDSHRSSETQGTSTAANANLTYTRRLNTRGRNLKISGGWESSDNLNTGTWRSDNRFPMDAKRDSLYQSREDISRNRSWNTSVSYTEPLAEKHFLEFSARTHVEDESLVRNTEDRFGGGFQPQYSPDFELYERAFTGTVAYKYSGEVHNFNVDLRTQYFTQQASELRQMTEIPVRRFTFLMPSVEWIWSPSPSTRMIATYSTGYDMPGLTQLLRMEDITNPLVVRQGNAELQPAYRNNLWAHFSRWNAFDGTSTYFNMYASHSTNPIGTHQQIDSQYVRTFTPENFENSGFNANFSGGYTFPLKFVNLKTRIGLNTGYNRQPGRINGELNLQDNTNAGMSLRFYTDKSEIWDLGFGGNVNYNWSTFSLQERLNQTYINQRYFANIEFTPNKRFGTETGLNMNVYSSESFADRQIVPVWNANVYYNLLKEGTAQFKLTVYDILDQNRGVSRYGSMNAIVERNTNSLGRYVMVTFLYKFNKV